MSDDRIRRRVVVEGRVQGVGFRYFAVQEAERLGVSGWVRNLLGGSQVEVEVEGPPSAVGEMVAAMRRGPRWASVSRAQVTEVEPQGSTSFQVLFDR